MAFIAQDNGGGDFKRVPPGVYIGRCYSLIDLGTQRVEFQGEVNLQHKILVRWELFGEDENGEPLTIDRDGRTLPMTVSKRYTLSLSNKARLRSDLEAWRGRKFTAEEVSGFDVAKLLGAYCMVNVTENTSDDGKRTYTNVSSLTPLPGALKNARPDPVHQIQVFDLDKPDMNLFSTFHEKLQDTIRAAMEWKEVSGTGNSYQAAKNGGFENANQQAQLAAQDDMDGDIPF